MGNKLLGGLLTVAGGGVAGYAGGTLDRIKEEALAAREENRARLNDMYARTRAAEGHGYRMEEIAQADVLAGGRETGRRDFELKRDEQKFQQGILQRETEAGIAETKAGSRFARELEKTLATAKLATEIKDDAKTQVMKTRDDLVAMGKTEEEANEISIATLKTAKETGMDRATKYSKIHKNYLDGLAGGLPPEPEMEAKAAKLTDDLLEKFLHPKSSMDVIKSPGEKDGESHLDRLLRESEKATGAAGETKAGPILGKTAPQAVSPETPVAQAKRLGEQNLIPGLTDKDVEIQGTTQNGFQFGFSKKDGTVIKKYGGWNRPTDLEFDDITIAMSGKGR